MKKEMKILLWTSIFTDLAGGFLAPIYAVFVEQIGGNLLTAGSTVALFSIVSGIFIFVFGRLEDKIKNKEKMLVFGRCLSVMGFAGYLFVSDPVHLFVVQAIFGIALAVKSPAFKTLYSKNLERGHYASEWGILGGTYRTALGISAIIGGFLAQKYGFKIVLIIMLITSIISLLISLLLLNSKNIKEK